MYENVYTRFSGEEFWSNLDFRFSDKVQADFPASSEEYWTMNESLIQQYYLNEDGFFSLKL